MKSKIKMSRDVLSTLINNPEVAYNVKFNGLEFNISYHKNSVNMEMLSNSNIKLDDMSCLFLDKLKLKNNINSFKLIQLCNIGYNVLIDTIVEVGVNIK